MPVQLTPDTTELDAPLAELIHQRFEEICDGEPYDPDIHGQLFLVEAGDTAADIEEATGCPLLRNPFSGKSSGDPGFSPLWECLEEHPDGFEMVFVPGDGDFGIVIFIPKIDGIATELLSLCVAYASPAIEEET